MQTADVGSWLICGAWQPIENSLNVADPLVSITYQTFLFPPGNFRTHMSLLVMIHLICDESVVTVTIAGTMSEWSDGTLDCGIA